MKINKRSATEFSNVLESQSLSFVPSIFGTIDSISAPGITILPDSKALDAFQLFNQNEELMEICVVDKARRFCGIVTRNAVLRDFGGLYGYNLHKKKYVADIMKKDSLLVDSDMSVESVSKMAMERVPTAIYDAVVVLKNDVYFGVVTVRDLLSTAVTIQVKRATEANPLTELPGNKTIEEQIGRLVGRKDFFAIMYLDLDNFKAYNDAYGFNSGDRMIMAVAEAMKYNAASTEFLGHIGGDDFVVISCRKSVEKLAKQICDKFRTYLADLYSQTDWERGYIVSKNRNGLTENFPIASLSIAIVTNLNAHYSNIKSLSEQIVAAKKKAKKIKGNSIVAI